MEKNIQKGSRKVSKIVEKAWTEEILMKALHKLESTPGATIRGVANELGVCEATIRFRLKKANLNEELGKAGRKCAFTPETEARLTKCINILCNYGFSPSIGEIQVCFQIKCSIFVLYKLPFFLYIICKNVFVQFRI